MRDGPTRATLPVIVASATLTVMAGAVLGPVVPGIQDGVGVSESLAGLIITTHGAFIVLTSPIAGALIDRYGPRRPYLAGLGIYAIGGGAGLFIDSFLPLLASRAVLGVGVAFVYTAITVLIYDLYRGDRMDRALGLRSGANSAGAAVWPLVGGALGVVSWQFPFAVYLLAVPLGVVALAAIPNTGRGGSDVATDGDGLGAATERSGALGVLRRRPALLAVYLLYFAANALLYAVVVFYPQLLTGIGIDSPFGIGLYLSANGIAGGVAGVLYGRLKGQFGAHPLVAVAFGLWIVAFALATVVASPLEAFAPVVLIGVGIGLVFPSTFVWVESLAPTAQQGQFGSYVAMAGYVGQFVSPVAFGPLVAPFGVRAVFAAAALVAVVGLASFAAAVRR
ncbi:MAG: MFS transporter [Natronomonas sp.]|uniref:MFS transporter n=1 Tax=Natronomonas sp. TaxID=2184060 RepID=UPI00287090AB|nr:MFS transporter [Natronomonas sp.]MDR9429802.1 MFS transporter [Natronomonas sp.]